RVDVRIRVQRQDQVRVGADRPPEMRGKVSDLAQQPRVEEEQVVAVVDPQVSIAADRRHEESRPTRKSVWRTCDRVDHTPIEGKEEQVVEAGRKVPPKPWFVEDAEAPNGAVVLEAANHACEGRDVLVLDAAAVIPEVRRCLENGRVELALALID